MPKSCNKVFSYSIAISDCVPLSSDGEERPGYISIPSINNYDYQHKTPVLVCAMWMFQCPYVLM